MNHSPEKFFLFSHSMIEINNYKCEPFDFKSLFRIFLQDFIWGKLYFNFDDSVLGLWRKSFPQYFVILPLFY